MLMTSLICILIASLILDSIQVTTAQPNDSMKLQHLRGLHRRLAPPLKIFDFDWASADLAKLEQPRASAPLPLRIERAGRLTALVVYFDLDLDGRAENVLCTGPDSPNIAWDQGARFLPVPLAVEAGDELTVVGRHTDAYFQTIELSGFSADMLLPDLGVPHLVGNPNGRALAVALAAPAAETRSGLPSRRAY